jgi:hypothetical protein
MGGAIVDSLVGAVPKDYDIFCTKRVGWNIPQNWKYIKPENADQIKARQAEYDIENKQGLNPIKEVNDFDVELDDKIIRVQLIYVDYDDARKHLKNFDHTLTLAWFSKNGVYIHRKVFESLNTKTVTLLNNKKPEKSKLRALKKIEKLDPEGKDNWKLIGWE